MNNCLLTTLKAVVNNPNLPILETMQQLTLDAIAASGNSGMSDAQRWALNHFFYEIGAISNSGIWSKTAALFMPLICNQNTDKAMYDYKNNSNIELRSGVVFSGNGLITNGPGSPISSNISLTSGSKNLYVASGYANLLSISNIQTVANTYKLIEFNKMAKLGGGEGDIRYEWFGQAMLYYTPISSNYGFVMTKNDEAAFTGAFIGESQTYPIKSVRELEDAPEDITGTIQILPQINYFPTGIYAIGYSLTTAECITLADAIRKLIVAFPSTVNA